MLRLRKRMQAGAAGEQVLPGTGLHHAALFEDDDAVGAPRVGIDAAKNATRIDALGREMDRRPYAFEFPVANGQNRVASPR